ncbi:MAG: sodium-dependent transporter, partial [Thermoleophilia bacterium]|nr:sodium-dependent transporter [Thermoleophilia bacterium]
MEGREPAGGAVGREQWSSRVGFILAAVGSAVGLGNVWRFPYITGKYGGAAFVLVYLLAVVLLGIPLMLTEFALGRNTQRNATGALRKLAPGTLWWLLGMSSVTVGVLVLSFYASVTGWTLAYVVRSVAGTYSGLTPEQVGAAFGRFLNSSAEVIFWQFLVMVLTVYVVAKGVKSGIETACKYMMPALVIMELALVVRSLTLPGAAKGLEFYLKPDFRKLSGAAVLAAVGQCFFSLNVGAGQ